MMASIYESGAPVAGRRRWLGVFRSSWFQTAAAAAVVGVAAAAWFLIKPRSGVGGAGGSQQEVFTAVGSRTHMTLPDGTKVWLNAGSRIHYEKSFGEQGREISLVGEAFFDVASNPKKPFIIHTAKLDIRVLGTSFNVKSYPSDKTTEATLVRGMIEVSILDRPADKIVLKPNEKLIVTNKDSLAEDLQTDGAEDGPAGQFEGNGINEANGENELNGLNRLDSMNRWNGLSEPNRWNGLNRQNGLNNENGRTGPSGYNGAYGRHREQGGESMVVIGKPTYDHRSGAMIETSWVDNRLIFQDQNFGELARMMERWYGVTIRFGNEDLKELHFTGILEKESVKQALDALKITATFGYSIEGKTITIHD
jgi:ferric-dicitrate binding protein FerR (iron transport regulator)